MHQTLEFNTRSKITTFLHLLVFSSVIHNFFDVVCICLGSMFGTFVILPVSGMLIDAYGWESVFYFSGLSTLVWGVLWLTIVKDDPRQHPWISEAELKQILGDENYNRHSKTVARMNGNGKIVIQRHRGVC